MKYDLHIHTKYSRDGYTEPELIVNTAIKRGLSGVAITDHNTIKGGLKTEKYETNDLKIIVGSEIETDRGEVIGLFLSEEIKPGTFTDVVQEIRDQNGLVILPHPFDTTRGNGLMPTDSDAPLIDCVEVYNSRCLRETYNHRAYEFTLKNKLGISAGSDSHFASEIGRAGIITNSPITSPKEFIKGTPTVFGGKTSIVNLGLTKILKMWKGRTVKGGSN